ncbi:hypothetical protein JCM3774_004168 [Rhodotorula dairenensis]
MVAADKTPMNGGAHLEDGHGLGLSAVPADELELSIADGRRSALGLDTLSNRAGSLSLGTDPPPLAPALEAPSSPPLPPARAVGAHSHSHSPRDGHSDAPPSWVFPKPSPTAPDSPKSAPVSPCLRRHTGPPKLAPRQQLLPVLHPQSMHSGKTGRESALTGSQQESSPAKRLSPGTVTADFDQEEEDILSAIGLTPTRSTASHASVSPAESRSSLAASLRRPPGSTEGATSQKSFAASDAAARHVLDESFSFERPGMATRMHTDPTGTDFPRRTSSGRVSFASDHSAPSARHDESFDRSRSPQRRGSVVPHFRVPLLGAIGRRKSASPGGTGTAPESGQGGRGHLRFTSLLAAMANGSHKHSRKPRPASSAGELYRPPSILTLSRSRSRNRDPLPQELKEAIRNAPKLKKAYDVPQVSPELERSPKIDALPYTMKGEAKVARLLGVAAADENARFSPHYTVEDISHLPRFPAEQEKILDLALTLADLHKYNLAAGTNVRQGKASFKRRGVALTRTSIPAEPGTFADHAYTLHAFRTTHLDEPESARLRLSATSVICIPTETDYTNVGEGKTRLPYALYVSGTGSFRAGLGLDQYEKKTSWILGMQDLDTFTSWLDMLKEVARELRASASQRLPSVVAAGKTAIGHASQRTMDANITQLDAQLGRPLRRPSSTSTTSDLSWPSSATEKSNVVVTDAAQVAEDQQAALEAAEEATSARECEIGGAAVAEEEPLDPTGPNQPSQSGSAETPLATGSSLQIPLTVPPIHVSSSARPPSPSPSNSSIFVNAAPLHRRQRSGDAGWTRCTRPLLTSKVSGDSQVTDCSLPSLTSTASSPLYSSHLTSDSNGYFDFAPPPPPAPAPNVKSPLQNVVPLCTDSHEAAVVLD